MQVLASARRFYWYCILLGTFAYVHPVHASPPGTGWGLSFADEFSGKELDTMKWSYNYPWGQTSSNRAFTNPNQVGIDNGNLVITAIDQRDPTAPPGVTVNGQYFSLDYTSGAINTSAKLSFTEGYVEGRFQMPSTSGTWSTFSMLQSGWPPEIDIFEVPSVGTSYFAKYHYGADLAHHQLYTYPLNTTQQLSQGFHTFGVEWSPTYMKFYFDGVMQRQVTDTSAISQAQNMYLLINLAIGGWAENPPPGAVFPTTLQADWVHVWEKTATYPASTSWTQAGSGLWDTASSWSNGSPRLNTQTATFGAVSASDVMVDWSNSHTVGGVRLNSSTNYTLGNGNDESIMLANPSGTALIDATDASGGSPNIINARLELYNNVTIRSPNKTLLLNGVITGQNGLRIESGQIAVNGNVNYSAATTVTGGELIFNGDAILPGTASILGGTLQINSLSASMHNITGSSLLNAGNGSTATHLTADSIAVGSLNIASGAIVTINPVGSTGTLAASAQVESVPEPSILMLILSAAAGALMIKQLRK